MHRTDDGRVIPGNERAYLDLVSRHGGLSLLKEVFVSRGGHCAFSDAEIIAGLQTLVQRVDRGSWPDTSPATMNARTAKLAVTYQRSAPLNYTITNSGQFVAYDPVPLPR